MATQLFINYRRDDDAGHAGRLYDFLSHRMSKLDIFMDVEQGITLGDDFVTALYGRVSACRVMLVMIGPRWLELLSAHSALERDFVAFEIGLAIELNKIVIPVLVGRNLRMPDAHELPERLRPLAQRQAAVLRPDSFHGDCIRLLAGLQRGGHEMPVTSNHIAQVETGLEAEAWRRVVQEGSGAQLRDFLETWPDGPHADAAHMRLVTIGRGVPGLRSAAVHVIGRMLDGIAVLTDLVPYGLAFGAILVYLQPIPVPNDGPGPDIPEWTAALIFLVTAALSWWPMQWLSSRFIERSRWVLYTASTLTLLPSGALMVSALSQLQRAPADELPYLVWVGTAVMGLSLGGLMSSAALLSRPGDL